MHDELREVLLNVLEVDSISESDSAETVGSWDSVRHLSLILALEERFAVTFDTDEIPALISVRKRSISRATVAGPASASRLWVWPCSATS